VLALLGKVNQRRIKAHRRPITLELTFLKQWTPAHGHGKPIVIQKTLKITPRPHRR
jgi:hypothetical protein